MPENPWFETDGPEDEFGFNAVEIAFATALRERARSWTAPPAYSWVGRPDGDSSLLAVVGLSDRDNRISLAHIGVHMIDCTIRGDRLHNQLYCLPSQPTDLAMEATGSPEELAEAAAAWFEAILLKPVVRYEWEHNGQIYAERYLFADTGKGLCQRYSRTLAPQGQAESLIASGHVAGQGWIQTSGLDQPTRIVNVRGEITA